MVESLVPQKYSITINSLPVFNGSGFIFKPMDSKIISFLNDLSKRILKDRTLRLDPSYASLGFWLRKSNMNKIVDENKTILEFKKVKIQARGIVFHLCPSNVDTMFFYSLAIALLAGNKNIVRVSSRIEHPLIDKLFIHINELLKNEYPIFLNYLNIIKYGREEEYNNAISLKCDGRIIWGGDETINQFKAIKTKPKVKDLYFADRISLSIIDAKSVIELEVNELADVCKKLYNDIYTFDQKGCSSPHALFLIGSEDYAKKAIFLLYKEVIEIAKLNYDNDINSMASIKFNQIAEDVLNGNSMPFLYENNYLTINELMTNEVPHTCGHGYIYYKSLNKIEDIAGFLSEKVQTIGYYGFSKSALVSLQDISLTDRIVPIGSALDFDYIWDGYNILLEMLSFKYLQ
jgi:hypothetical protein